MVGLELMAMGMHFDSCGSLPAPIPGLFVSLGILVELVQGGLDNILSISPALKSLVRASFLLLSGFFMT